MAQRTEAQIMQNWKIQEPPLVSVICITYNHEPYIKDAIEGFLMQETDFAFEVIIHNDASTDKTAEIVREYAEKYPKIIKPIYQAENQYSQGKKCSVIAIGYAKGKYIALCEGDDYWIDPNKLQNQFDMVRQYGVDYCFHKAYMVNEKKYKNLNFCNKYKEVIVISVEDVISEAGQFAPTASYFIKKEIFNHKLLKILNDAPIGDYFIEVFASLKKGALCIPKFMSVYRVGSIDSWSERIQNNIDSKMKFARSMLASLNELDACLNFVYSESIKKKKGVVYLNIALTSLFKRSFDDFKKYIEIGFSLVDKKQKSKKIKICYYFRKFPKLVFLLLYCIKKLKFYRNYALQIQATMRSMTSTKDFFRALR